MDENAILEAEYFLNDVDLSDEADDYFEEEIPAEIEYQLEQASAQAEYDFYKNKE